MARPKPTNTGEWELEGAEAILDLVTEKVVVPIPSLEAIISVRGWKDFYKVQPVQLRGARRRLVSDGLIEEIASRHHPPVTVARVPISPGRKREIERITGSVRKFYRRYVAWTGDHAKCGKHAERVVLASLEEAASKAGLWVPPQPLGRIQEVQGVHLPGEQTLDATANILKLPDGGFSASLVIEVKNIHSWIYPSSRELWELLVKAAHLPPDARVVPLLVCARTAFQTAQMAKDLGFFVNQMGTQVFSPALDDQEFDSVINQFGLIAARHEGPLESVVSVPNESSSPEPSDQSARRRRHRVVRETSRSLPHDGSGDPPVRSARWKHRGNPTYAGIQCLQNSR